MRLLLLTVCLCLCTITSVAVEVDNGYGQVLNFSKPPKTIALAPVVSDIIFELGAEENLIAVSSYTDTRGKNIQTIGSAYGLDWEKLIALNPDLVICSYIQDDFICKRLQTCGIKYMRLHKEGLANIPKDIRLLGKVFFKTSKANDIADKFENLVNTPTSPSNLKAIFLLGNVAAGRGSFVSDVLKAGGFKNCVEKISSPWPVVSREFVLGENPDVIFIATHLNQTEYSKILQQLNDDIAWSATNAVKNKRVYFVPFNDIILPSVRVVNTINYIRKIKDQIK